MYIYMGYETRNGLSPNPIVAKQPKIANSTQSHGKRMFWVLADFRRRDCVRQGVTAINLS